MKKIILLIIIVLFSSLLSGKYIVRNAESNTRFNEYEYKQGGILYRFDFQQVEYTTLFGDTMNMWHYKEIWLPEDTDKETLDSIIQEEELEEANSENFNDWKAETDKPIHILGD